MMNSITTKTGDQGMTDLFSGERVSKSHPRMDATGEIDELNSVLGWASVAQDDPGISALIRDLQRSLFQIGSFVATSAERGDLVQTLTEADLEDINRICAEVESRIVMPDDFILPGGCEAAARLDLARSVSRRCERALTVLVESGLVPRATPSAWLNRLSDLLWLLARQVEGDRTVLRRS